MSSLIYCLADMLVSVVYYLQLLIFVEIIYFGFISLLDYYCKQINYSKVIRGKVNMFLVRSKYEEKHNLPTEGRPVHIVAAIFQFINWIYVIAWIVFSLIHSYRYHEFDKAAPLIRSISNTYMFSLGSASLIIGILAHKRDRKDHTERYKDDGEYDFDEYKNKHED